MLVTLRGQRVKHFASSLSCSVKAVLSFRLKLESISFRFLFYLIEQTWVISCSCLRRTTRRCTKF